VRLQMCSFSEVVSLWQSRNYTLVLLSFFVVVAVVVLVLLCVSAKTFAISDSIVALYIVDLLKLVCSSSEVTAIWDNRN